jgi:catechol 2,3-dioxygenase-like lactoylglutathione lyase family enzyme
MNDFANMYHVGIRVPDIDVAMVEIGSAMGVTWASMQDREMTVWLAAAGDTPAGLVTVPLRFTYSCEGPVHLELVQGPPGSVWDGNDFPGPHHFGVWSDDVGAQTADLIARGWTLVLSQAPPEEGYGRFTYVRSPQGFIVEPVTSANRARFEGWFAGASLT